MNAKAFITSRINLEAKRFLAHTDVSVTLIAEGLGFEEVTNFIKFFKRKTGCTPAEFRRRQAAVDARYGSTPENAQPSRYGQMIVSPVGKLPYTTDIMLHAD